jgi:group II intron reverse transcriptase/maturase
MRLVEKRVTDPKVLRLIRKWLKAGIMEDGKVTYPKLGSPQGSGLSPLLSNIYLNELDTEWGKRRYADVRVADCHLIRYADDLVILCSTEGKAKVFYRKVEEIVKGLGLKVNTQKTQVVHAREGFDFLGFSYRIGYSRRLKKEVPIKIPRARAMKSIRGRIKEVIKSIPLGEDIREIIPEVNSKLKGWANYFRVGNAHKTAIRLTNYACSQLRLYLRRKYQTKCKQRYQIFPNHYFYERGLCYAPSLL